jgi:hypothetical protein
MFSPKSTAGYDVYEHIANDLLPDSFKALDGKEYRHHESYRQANESYFSMLKEGRITRTEPFRALDGQDYTKFEDFRLANKFYFERLIEISENRPDFVPKKMFL